MLRMIDKALDRVVGGMINWHRQNRLHAHVSSRQQATTERWHLREISEQMNAYLQDNLVAEQTAAQHISNKYVGTPEASATTAFVAIARAVAPKGDPSRILKDTVRAYQTYQADPAHFRPQPWMEETRQSARAVFKQLARQEQSHPTGTTYPAVTDYLDGFFRAGNAMDILLQRRLGDPAFTSDWVARPRLAVRGATFS